MDTTVMKSAKGKTDPALKVAQLQRLSISPGVVEEAIRPDDLTRAPRRAVWVGVVPALPRHWLKRNVEPHSLEGGLRVCLALGGLEPSRDQDRSWTLSVDALTSSFRTHRAKAARSRLPGVGVRVGVQSCSERLGVWVEHTLGSGVETVQPSEPPRRGTHPASQSGQDDEIRPKRSPVTDSPHPTLRLALGKSVAASAVARRSRIAS